MFKNYFKIAIRNINKHKGYSFINVIGLAIGIACCILIMLFVRSELNYDKFHEKAEQIHRIGLRFNVGANQFDAAIGPVPTAKALVKDYPEVIAATRLFARQSRGGDVFVRYKDMQFKEKKFLWTDATIFDVFTLKLLEGDPDTALKEPHSVIMTNAMAQKYFSKKEPIGKMLTLEDGSIYKVTGIVEEFPLNSHIHFDFLASFSSLPKSQDPDWYDTAVFTYIVLQNNFPASQFKEKLPEFSRRYMAPVIEKIMGVNYDQFLEAGNEIGFILQPLLDIHLHSELGNELEPQGNMNTVLIFLAIAFLILIVACINFINLTTARSTQRANEVGVRKVIGSTRRQILRQFLGESLLLTLTSVLFALILVEIFLPVFNNLVGKQFSPAFLRNLPFLAGIVFGALMIGFAAGFYPAFVLASFQPVRVLRGKIQTGAKGRLFRNLLVIFQFGTTVILFISTVIIYNQLHFVRNKKLGFDKDQIVVIQRAEKLGHNQQAFKNRLKQNSSILSATYTDSLPQMLLEVKIFQKEEASNENHTLITISADHDFMETYRPNLHEGRFFERERSTDSSAVILNEAAVKALTIDNPLEKRIILTIPKKIPMHIIGIFENFHLQPLQYRIGPMAAILKGKLPGVLLSVRLQKGKIKEGLSSIQKAWNEFLPDQPLEHVFFDDQFNLSYMSEIQDGKVMTTFACLAIFIACLGLFGLASFTASQRTKEIGIRKVMGASVPRIMFLLSKQFVKWVLIANLIAWPVAYFTMSTWLQNFAYRIDVHIWMFVLSAFVALLIALITVSYQTIKAARTHPANSLRYE